MVKYTCSLWDKSIKEDIEDIINTDPYNTEHLHSREELQQYINTYSIIQEPLFSRSDSRLENSYMADFLHGRCLRFQNFAFSVLKADKSQHAPLCLECMQLPDSVHHKLFECSLFESEERSHLQHAIGHLEVNYHFPLVFGILEANGESTIPPELRSKEIRKHFRKQVINICSESMFGDDLLTKNGSMSKKRAGTDNPSNPNT